MLDETMYFWGGCVASGTRLDLLFIYIEQDCVNAYTRSQNDDVVLLCLDVQGCYKRALAY
jgi:hypothetical protein